MNKVWWNVFDADTHKFICGVRDDAENPHMYDPRIGGSGNVIWQIADQSTYAEAETLIQANS